VLLLAVTFHGVPYPTLPLSTFSVTMVFLYLCWVAAETVHKGLDRLVADDVPDGAGPGCLRSRRGSRTTGPCERGTAVRWSMHCPRCQHALDVVDDDAGLTVDFCPGCGGIFFDEGEFQAFYGLSKEPTPSAGDLCNITLLCPRCEARMVEWDHGDGEPLLIDHCTSCRGLWVDRGEGARLRDLLRARGPATGPTRFREVPHPDGPGDPEPWYVPILQAPVQDSSLQWKWILGGVALTVLVQISLIGVARFWLLQDALQEAPGTARNVELTALAGLMGFPIGGWLVGRNSRGHTVLEPMIAAVPASLLFAWFFHQEVGPALTIGLMMVGTVLALVAAGIAEQGD
jgi:Zn-finger nucleic acid-binding protein